MPEWPHTYADHQQAAVGHLPGSGGGASSNSSNHSGQQQHDFYALDARQQKCYAHPYYQGPPQVVPSSVHSGEPWSHPPFPLTTLPQHPVVQTNSSDTYAATPFTNHCSNADANTHLNSLGHHYRDLTPADQDSQQDWHPYPSTRHSSEWHQTSRMHAGQTQFVIRAGSLPTLDLHRGSQSAAPLGQRSFSGPQELGRQHLPPPDSGPSAASLTEDDAYLHSAGLPAATNNASVGQPVHPYRPEFESASHRPTHALPILTLTNGYTSNTYNSRECFDFYSVPPSASSTSAATLSPTSPLTPAHQQKTGVLVEASPDSETLPTPPSLGYGVFAMQQSTAPPPPPVTLTAPPKTSKSTQDVMVSCMSCTKRLLRLYKRGTPVQLTYPGELCFRCDDCASREIGPCVEPNIRKRGRAASYNPGAAVICDVCRRNIGRGGILWPVDEDEEQYRTHFTAELACLDCDVKYKKCSDCGGGGGRRGAGKWRANEMFEGRKTCVLSHKRTASALDTEHRTMDIEDLEPDELDHYYTTCESLFRINMLANLAVPEMMESADKSARPVNTFEAILELVKEGWYSIGALLYAPQEGVESKRYLAIRTGRQQRRKNVTKSTAEKEIVGFAMLEYDFRAGVVFFRVVIPWSTGDGIESSTAMIDDALEVCHRQRDAFVEDLCSKGMARPLAEVTYPPITVTWTMLFLAKESRIIGWMERKRNFTVLNQFLADNPDVNPQNFPPHRPVFLPVKAQTGWTILAKRIRRGQSEGAVTYGRKRGR